MQTITASLVAEYPSTNKGHGILLVGLVDRIVGDSRPILLVLTGGVALLLVIAWINLANLLLVRSAARAGEFAVHAALGADRRRLVQQILTEQTILVVVGGVLGALVGVGVLRSLITLAPHDTPRLDEVRLDHVVPLWTTAISSLCAFAFGLIPAIRQLSEPRESRLQRHYYRSMDARHRRGLAGGCRPRGLLPASARGSM
jgi:ABC-type antimicrobial peptide transport system permease subunit